VGDHQRIPAAVCFCLFCLGLLGELIKAHVYGKALNVPFLNLVYKVSKKLVDIDGPNDVPNFEADARLMTDLTNRLGLPGSLTPQSTKNESKGIE
jgi:hypothetical protein